MPALSNSKHELFALEIAQGKSAAEAYVIAGYSKNDSNAARLNGNERIRSRVEELLSAAASKAGVTIERVVEELAKIGFADITQAVEWGEAVAVRPENGGDAEIVQGIAMKPSAELDPNVSAAIAEVRKTREGISIKFHDKKGALELLGRHLGMFKDKVEHSGPGGGPIQSVTMTASEFEAVARRVADEV